MEIPLDKILFYKMFYKKFTQTEFWNDQCGAKINGGEADTRWDKRQVGATGEVD